MSRTDNFQDGGGKHMDGEATKKKNHTSALDVSWIQYPTTPVNSQQQTTQSNKFQAEIPSHSQLN